MHQVLGGATPRDPRQAIHSPTPAQPPLPTTQAYIDFEIGEGNREGARELYERLLQVSAAAPPLLRLLPLRLLPLRLPGAPLWRRHATAMLHVPALALALPNPVRRPLRPPRRTLQRTRHVKVWLSYAKFEATPLAVLATPPDEDEEAGEEAAAARLAEAEEAEGGAAGTGAHAGPRLLRRRTAVLPQPAAAASAAGVPCPAVPPRLPPLLCSGARDAGAARVRARVPRPARGPARRQGGGADAARGVARVRGRLHLAVRRRCRPGLHLRLRLIQGRAPGGRHPTSAPCPRRPALAGLRRSGRARVAAVEKKLPRRVKRKRPIVLDDGSRPGGMEEFYGGWCKGGGVVVGMV